MHCYYCEFIYTDALLLLVTLALWTPWAASVRKCNINHAQMHYYYSITPLAGVETTLLLNDAWFLVPSLLSLSLSLSASLASLILNDAWFLVPLLLSLFIQSIETSTGHRAPGTDTGHQANLGRYKQTYI